MKTIYPFEVYTFWAYGLADMVSEVINNALEEINACEYTEEEIKSKLVSCVYTALEKDLEESLPHALIKAFGEKFIIKYPYSEVVVTEENAKEEAVNAIYYHLEGGYMKILEIAETFVEMAGIKVSCN